MYGAVFRSDKVSAAAAGANDDDDDVAAAAADSGCGGGYCGSVLLSPPPRRDTEPRFVAVVNECRANPVVSRRGYLLISDSKEKDESTAIKRWVVRKLGYNDCAKSASYPAREGKRVVSYRIRREDLVWLIGG